MARHILDRRHGRRATRSPRVAYRASVLTPRAGSTELLYLPNALLVVDNDGTIEALTSAEPTAGEPPFRGVIHDLPGSLVVPAFVDAHLHFPQTRAIGSATGPLLEWLERTVFPEEARFIDPTYAREVAREFVLHAASCGTGTVGAFSSSSPLATEVLLDTMLETGLRGLVGLTLMDERCPEVLRLPADRAIEATRDLVERFHKKDDGRVEVAVTPRFALSCSRRLMEEAGKLAQEKNLAVQTHVSENVHEAAETLNAFPWASDYLDVYDKLGLLGRRTILAHAIHLSPSEWDRVGDRGAAIAHCPDSNAFLGSGRMRLSEARERGVRVALGSDVAAGRTFDIRRAIAHAHDNALALGDRHGVEELFRMATLGGAETLGLDDRTGSLEAGKDADFVVLSLPPYLHGREDALRAACFGSEIARVERTYVKGRLVYRARGVD